MRRVLRLDICDYNKNVVCNIYDYSANISGQAYNVFIEFERNGWKELSFNIPSKMMTEEGETDNYRVQYLQADYKIRTEDENEVDWYLISEQKITNDTIKKELSVSCKHVSQLLKTKKQELEFSDKEGNNGGTAEQLLDVILEGTTWHKGKVYNFLEDDGITPKYRTITASSKSGALKLISVLCEKFDAKAVYHGEAEYTYIDDNGHEQTAVGQVVDILPLNPFSEEHESGIPKEVLEGNVGVVELNYKRNLKSVSRTLNTDNIITKLYVYGDYGDTYTGYGGLKECKHNELTFELSANYPAGTEFMFSFAGAYYYFVPEDPVGVGSIFHWSDIDILSRSYIYTASKIYSVYKESKVSNPILLEPTSVEIEENYVPYLLNFSYYRRVGLLTDEHLAELVKYQQKVPALYKASKEASQKMSDANKELSETAESVTGFLRLAVSSHTIESEKVVLNIDSSVGDNGVMYRSDWDNRKEDYFAWNIASQIKPNGDSIDGGSKVLILHDTDPISWDFAYLKEVYNEAGRIEDEDGEPARYDYGLVKTGDPTKVILWLTDSEVKWTGNEQYFLFCTDSLLGKISAAFSARESTLLSLEEELTKETVKHNVILTDLPDEQIYETDIFVEKVNDYGWLYKFNKTGESYRDTTLYYIDFPRGVDTWRKVYFADEPPAVDVGHFFFHNKERTLWYGTASQSGLSSSWVKMGSKSDEERATTFSYVIKQCHELDRIYKGWYEKYEYNHTLTAGNYAMRNEYGEYWLFTTHMDAERAWLDVTNSWMYVDDNPENVETVRTYPFDTLYFPIENLLDKTRFTKGNLNESGNEIEDETTVRSGYVHVYPLVTYDCQFSAETAVKVYIYDKDKRLNQTIITVTDDSGLCTFTTAGTPEPPQHPDGKYVGEPYYARIVLYTTTYRSSFSVKMNDCNNKVIAGNEVIYTLLPDVNKEGGFVGSGDYLGINNIIKEFRDLANSIYYDSPLEPGEVRPEPDGGYYGLLTKAQNEIKEADIEISEKLGDLLREGTWQDNSYGEDDGERLYKDAMKNSKQIAEPEATYDISFIDPYSANEALGYSITDETDSLRQEINVTDAVHLIDEDLDENRWAYIDKLRRCYDFAEKTTMQINTNLSFMNQHSFTDVMTHIVDVTKETRANQTIYSRASVINRDGEILAEKIKGTLNASISKISGGASNWATNESGNIVFTSDDGSSAMMLAGAGLMIADSKNESGDWKWRTALTGAGIIADAISSGTLDVSQLIRAGSISTNLLTSTFGEELDIMSNNALLLAATVDGERPAGSVDTAYVNPGNSYIQIAAETTEQSGGTTVKIPAHIDVVSGGKINLVGGSIDVQSDSNINITSDGKLIIESDTFSIDGDGNVELTGKITSTEGKIANWDIGEGQLSSGENATFVAIDSGSEIHEWVYDTQTSTWVERENIVTNPYVIWAGDANPYKAPFSIQRDGSVKASGNITAITGKIANWTIDGYKLYSGSGSNYVCLDSGTSGQNYVLWAGAEAATNAHFSIKRDGSLSIKGASSIDISGTGSFKVDVSNYNSQRFLLDSSDGVLTIGNWTLSDDNILYAEYGTAFQITNNYDKIDTTRDTSGFSHEINQFNLFHYEKNINRIYELRYSFYDNNSTSGTPKYYVEIGNEYDSGDEDIIYPSLTYYATEIYPQSWWVREDGLGGARSSCVGSSGKRFDIGGFTDLYYTTPHSGSSKYIKHNIKQISSYGDVLDKLQPVSYIYNEDKKERIRFGLIHEDTIDILPEICYGNKDSKPEEKSINYMDIIPLLLKEIQDLRKRVKSLEGV